MDARRKGTSTSTSRWCTEAFDGALDMDLRRVDDRHAVVRLVAEDQRELGAAGGQGVDRFVRFQAVDDAEQALARFRIADAGHELVDVAVVDELLLLVRR